MTAQWDTSLTFIGVVQYENIVGVKIRQGKHGKGYCHISGHNNSE